MKDKPDLSRLLAAKSVALVGASDRSIWTRRAVEHLTQYSRDVAIHLVNRRGGTIQGRPAAPSCGELNAIVDVGILLVPMKAVEEALVDLHSAGAGYAIILGGGFAETGDEGQKIQDSILATARRLGIRLLGPNSLGIVNFDKGLWLWSGTKPPQMTSGHIALVAQSGSMAVMMSSLAREQGINLSHVVATGNEADLDCSTFINHLIDDPQVKCVAAFIETIRNPAEFEAAAQNAFTRGKPIVVLKVGRSESSARSAQSHTGAIVGDDAIFDGICRQFGIIRVDSLEDLLFTSEMLVRTGEVGLEGVAVVSISGGMCSIAGDRAAAESLPLPVLPDALVQEIDAILPEFGTPNNPLDITGAAVADPRIFEACLKAIVARPEFSLVVCLYDVPTQKALAIDTALEKLRHISAGMRNAKSPVLLISHHVRPVTETSLEILESIDLPYISCGLDHGMTALGKVWWWSKRRKEMLANAGDGLASPQVGGDLPTSEFEALSYLSSHNVPVVPMRLATSAAEAISAAAALHGPCVLKIASPDIAHKSDIGGVELNISGDDAVASSFQRISAVAPDGAQVDGVLVAPMRPRGIELVVGIKRDAQWGQVIAVGLGGVWIETLKDIALRKLPIDANEARAMLDELKSRPLLDGSRGIPAADLPMLCDVIVKISLAAMSLGETLDTMEVNPLWVHGSHIEALDALCLAQDRSEAA